MKNLIRIYLGFQLFFSLLLWLPIFYEYQLRIGLSPSEIFRIQSIYYFAFCLLEIPTGLIADRLGYRRCMRWGAFALVIANLLAVFVQNYTGFLFHFLLIALSRSLISGASSAYLYDALESYGQRELYKDVEGKARAYGLIAKVVCWAGVGALMNWKLTLPYSLTAVSALIAFGFSMVMPEIQPRQIERRSESDSFGASIVGVVKQVWAAGRTTVTHPFLLLVMVQGIGLFVLGRIVQVNLFQPILSSKALSAATFGWIMSLMTVFEAAGSYGSTTLKRLCGDLNAVYLLTLTLAVSIAVIPYAASVGTILSLILFSLVSGVAFPIQKQLINDAIPHGAQRATLLSLESIIDRATCAWVASLLSSNTAKASGLETFLVRSAFATVAGLILLVVLHRAAKGLLAVRAEAESESSGWVGEK